MQAAWYMRHVRWTCLFHISFIIRFSRTKRKERYPSQRNSSSQQLLSLVLVPQPNSSQQQQARQIFQAPQINISPAASRTETSPQSNSTTKIFSSSEASPQDPPSSGSTRSASARDPESVRTGRDRHRKRARNEGRGPEIEGEGIPV